MGSVQSFRSGEKTVYCQSLHADTTIVIPPKITSADKIPAISETIRPIALPINQETTSASIVMRSPRRSSLITDERMNGRG